MGRKTSGKYESKKPAKMVSKKGRYESPKTDKKATRKKSDIDQEKIEAAEQVLEKYVPMIEELAKASADLLVGVAMRPVHKKLEKIQASFEAKREALDGVKNISKRIDRAIANAAKQEEQRLENFEKRYSPSIRSEDLEDKVGFRTAVTLGRTMIGSFSARVAKTPYTLAARYQALRGNEAKQNELLVMAKNASREVMGGLSKKNFDYLLDTKRIIKTFNAVDDHTTHYEQREAKVDAARGATERFVKRNKDGKVRSEVSLKLAHIGKKRIFKADDRAETIEDIGNWVARKAALKGHHKFARNVANKTVQKSDNLIKKAYNKNRKLIIATERVFDFADRRRKNIENAGIFIENLGKGITREASEEWKEAKDGFSGWMEDIETRREQQKVRRKFKSADRKVSTLSLLQRGAKGVLDMVESSLANAQRAKAAAQLDLEMNPENRKPKETSRGDRG